MNVSMLACGGRRLLLVLLLVAWLAPASVVNAEDCLGAVTWYHKGLALSDNTKKEAAHYQKAIELCPDYFEAHNKLGEVYKAWGDYESAIKEFNEASRSTKLAEPHYNLGEIYRMQGQYSLAIPQFKAAIRINPDFREAQNQLQYVQKRSGKLEPVPVEVVSETRSEPVEYEARPGPDSIEARPGPAPIEARPGPVPAEARPVGMRIGARPGTIPTFIFARIPGMTLPKHSFLADVQYKYWPLKSGLDLAEAFAVDERESDVHVLIAGLRYGVTDNFTVGVIPKYFVRQVDIPITFPAVGPGREVAGQGLTANLEVSGIGDTVVLTKYRLWQKGMTHLSTFLQVSIPTGDQDATAENNGVERTIPLGSGSVDLAPGIVFTTLRDKFTIQADAWYVFTDGRTAGDEFRADLGLAYRLLSWLVPQVELNYRWADEAEREVLIQTQLGQPPVFGPAFAPNEGGMTTQEVTLIEKGGQTLFVSPGLQVYLPFGFKAEVGAQFPVMKPDDGWAEDYVFQAGLVKYFF
jgi:hypothetical protein